MTGQMSLLDPPVDEHAATPLAAQPRVRGRLHFSDTPHDFKRELAAIVADEQRLQKEQT